MAEAMPRGLAGGVARAEVGDGAEAGVGDAKQRTLE